MCIEIFDLHDLNPSEPLINRLKYCIYEFCVEFAEIFDHKVQKIGLRSVHQTVESKILGLANQKYFLQIFSFMIDVFTPKRIYIDCHFKSIQKFTNFSILTPRCDAHCGA